MEVIFRVDFLDDQIIAYLGSLMIVKVDCIKGKDRQSLMQKFRDLVNSHWVSLPVCGGLWLVFLTPAGMTNLSLAISLAEAIVEQRGAVAIYDPDLRQYVVSATGNACYSRGQFVDVNGNNLI